KPPLKIRSIIFSWTCSDLNLFTMSESSASCFFISSKFLITGPPAKLWLDGNIHMLQHSSRRMFGQNLKTTVNLKNGFPSRTVYRLTGQEAREGMAKIGTMPQDSGVLRCCVLVFRKHWPRAIQFLEHALTELGELFRRALLPNWLRDGL